MLILQISAGLIIVFLTLVFISKWFALVVSRSLETALEWIEYQSALYNQSRTTKPDYLAAPFLETAASGDSS